MEVGARAPPGHGVGDGGLAHALVAWLRIASRKASTFFGQRSVLRASGPSLEKAIDQLGIGDCLVLSEWDRCTRSLLDGIALMVRIHERQAVIKALDRAAIDLTCPIGQGVLVAQRSSRALASSW